MPSTTTTTTKITTPTRRHTTIINLPFSTSSSSKVRTLTIHVRPPPKITLHVTPPPRTPQPSLRLTVKPPPPDLSPSQYARIDAWVCEQAQLHPEYEGASINLITQAAVNVMYRKRLRKLLRRQALARGQVTGGGQQQGQQQQRQLPTPPETTVPHPPATPPTTVLVAASSLEEEASLDENFVVAEQFTPPTDESRSVVSRGRSATSYVNINALIA